MNFETFALPAVILVAITAVLLLLSHDWRLSLSALGVMYIGVFALVGLTWSLEMAIVKLVAGWIAASVLGISLISASEDSKYQTPYLLSALVFRVSSAGLVSLVVISLLPGLQKIFPGTRTEQLIGGTFLLFIGILNLGFTSHPLKTILGLLTLLSGFEILYATVEASVLVAGFLALINMGLAMTGAYLVVAPALEVEQ